MVVRSLFLLCVFCLAGCASSGGGGKAAKSKVPPKKDATYFYLLSENDIRRNDIKAAFRHLDEAIAREPRSPHLRYKRATLHIIGGDLQKAEADLKEALVADPKDGLSWMLLGKIQQAQNRRDEAIASYQKAAQILPDSDEAFILLMEACLAVQDFVRAEGLVRSWQRANPESPTPLFYDAWLAENYSKNLSRAAENYRKILELDPDNIRAMGFLGEIYLKTGNQKGVLEVFRQMEALAPDDMPLQLKIALTYYEHKQFDKAIEKFRQVLKITPESDRVRYYLGVIYENLKRDSEAVGEFEQIPPKSNFYKDAALHRAYIRQRAGDADGAIRLLEEAIRIKPEVSLFYEYLAEIHQEQKNGDLAEQSLRRGLAKSPEKETLYYQLGLIQDQKKDQDGAVRSMREVLKLNPKNANALNYIGYVYADRGEQLDEALNLLNQAIQIKPGDGYITDSLGWAHFKKGDVEKALVLIERAHTMVPDEPTVLEHLGDIHLSLKQPKSRDRARRYFQQALAQLNKKKKTDDVERDKQRIQNKMRGLP